MVTVWQRKAKSWTAVLELDEMDVSGPRAWQGCQSWVVVRKREGAGVGERLGSGLGVFLLVRVYVGRINGINGH